jgi:hypothetical protein
VRETTNSWLFHQLGGQALAKVAALFSGTKIPLVPVKGIALGQWIYETEVDRPLRDLDLLIPRSGFDTSVELARRSGHEILYATPELGELTMTIDGFWVELHAEFGRRELTSLSTETVIHRARGEQLWGIDVLRVDDVDHFLLLAANVVKDGFRWSNPHQAEDLKRMLALLVEANRIQDLVDRTREASFVSALRSVGDWMVEEHHCAEFERLQHLLSPPRVSYSILTRIARKLPLSQRNLGLLVGCWANDTLSLRSRCTWRLVRRGGARFLGRDPD